MSKERELIQRAQQLALEASYIIGDAKPEFTKLCADLDEYLSKPEQEQEQAVEPVAWGETNGIGDVIDVITDDDRKHDVTQWSKSYTLPLYAHPPKRQPLSDDEIKKIWTMSAIFGTNLEKAVALTRAIEKAHGIGE